ncbi:MAG: PilZ domain-containing protein, partial [Phycisphaerales bacterium]|nr:PilZ domain-containing protein [Phycisphaerales bacterium]
MASAKTNRSQNVIQMRRDPNEVRSILESLDNNDEYAKSGERKLDRHQYRVKQVRIDLSNKDGSITSFGLPTRNISRDGIGLISTQFTYTGTPVIVHLISLQNHVFPVAGQVVRSRYLASTSGLYEMGVRFDRPIDLAVFHRSPPTVRLLVLDADAAAHRAIEQLLKGNLVGM